MWWMFDEFIEPLNWAVTAKHYTQEFLPDLKSQWLLHQSVALGGSGAFWHRNNTYAF